MHRLLWIVALAIFGFAFTIDAYHVGSYAICQSDSQCDRSSCCILGNYENSPPLCKPRQNEGDACRPQEELITNRTHYYADQRIELLGVHNSVCPCLEELVCDKRYRVCVNTKRY